MTSRQIQRLVGMEAGVKSPLSPLLHRGGPFEYGSLECFPLCKRGAGGDSSPAEIPDTPA